MWGEFLKLGTARYNLVDCCCCYGWGPKLAKLLWRALLAGLVIGICC